MHNNIVQNICLVLVLVARLPEVTMMDLYGKNELWEKTKKKTREVRGKERKSHTVVAIRSL